MIILFKNQIMEVMEWSESNFSAFYERYQYCKNQYRSDTPSYLYTDAYLKAVLSLFFYVYKHKITNKKSFLLGLLLNGLPYDKYNLNPNEYQDSFNESFMTPKLKTFIHQKDIDVFQFLCKANYQNIPADYSLLYFDYILFNDFRTAFKAVILPEERGLVIYHMNPAKIIFKIPKGSFDTADFIKGLELNLEKINNINIQDLYNEKIIAFKNYFNQKKNQ